MEHTSLEPHPASRQHFISVDVEASGPNPSDYSLLAIGACTIYLPRETFYVELAPVNDRFLPESLAVSGLSMELLREKGLQPQEAMNQLATWLKSVTPDGKKPVFVALNAPFDWCFINDYFHRYLGYNPFGHNALDMKALYMGLTGAPWDETYIEAMAGHYDLHIKLTHRALQDALDQAVIFHRLLEEIQK